MIQNYYDSCNNKLLIDHLIDIVIWFSIIFQFSPTFSIFSMGIYFQTDEVFLFISNRGLVEIEIEWNIITSRLS
jgi:hypothetical protein